MNSTRKPSGGEPLAAVHLAAIVLLLACGCAEDRLAEPVASSVPAPDAAAQAEPATIRQQALAALEAKDVDKADQLVRAAITEQPEDPEIVSLMAFVLAEQNRFYEASKMLKDLAEQVPSTRLTVMGQVAEWMVEQGRWYDAEEQCQRILAEVPDAVPVHRLLVQLYTREGRRWDAATHLRQLCRQGNIEEPELQALLRTFYSFSYDVDESEYEPINELGIAHYRISAGDWDAAAETLGVLSDKNAAESALLGRIFAQRQEFDRLSRWAEQVDDGAKVTPDYWFAMGAHHAHQGDHVAAIKSFCAAVVRDQTDQQAYALMSRSLEAIGAGAHARLAAQRAQFIQETQAIAVQLETNPDLNQMSKLIDLLDQLQRPFEALAWRAVQLIYARDQVEEPEAMRLLGEINQSRLQLLKLNQPIPSRSFVLCDVTPEVLQRAQTLGADDGGDQ